MNGITITLTIGKLYGGFYTRFTSISWRICLGWIALTIYFCDLEKALEDIDRMTKLKATMVSSLTEQIKQRKTQLKVEEKNLLKKQKHA